MRRFRSNCSEAFHWKIRWPMDQIPKLRIQNVLNVLPVGGWGKRGAQTVVHQIFFSGAPRAPSRGAPLIRDFGKPISARKFGLVMTSLRPTDRPPVRTYAPPCKPMWNETLKPCAATRVNFSAGNCVANCAAARVCLAGSCIANCVWEKNKK